MDKKLKIRDLVGIIRDLVLRLKDLQMQLEREKNRVKELEKIAGTDSLSGLLNRRALGEKRNVEPREIVVMIDLDGFKKTNDNHGHPVGDEIITIVGNIISSNIYPADLAFRYGGDEFLIIFKNCFFEKAEEKIRLIAEEYGKECLKKFGIVASLTAGIYCANEIMPTSQAIAAADEKMYEGKRKKKG